MSWACDECHKIATGYKGSEIHFVGSYGQCEACHRTGDTTDCRCPGAWHDVWAAVRATRESTTRGEG